MQLKSTSKTDSTWTSCVWEIYRPLNKRETTGKSNFSAFMQPLAVMEPALLCASKIQGVLLLNVWAWRNWCCHIRVFDGSHTSRNQNDETHPTSEAHSRREESWWLITCANIAKYTPSVPLNGQCVESYKWITTSHLQNVNFSGGCFLSQS